jgi:mannose-1-phosphate guanylyltransferase
MYAVILAGGGGTRLHPLSRPERPKPFLPLLGERSLLQGTVDRLSGLTDDITVVTDRRYRDIVQEQAPGVDVVVEPLGRNTAAAIALATLVIDRPQDEVMAVLPADQTVEHEAVFCDVLKAAAEHLATGSFGVDDPLVTLGIAADRPATEYGYLIPDVARGADVGGLRAYPLTRFEEKPNPARAEQLVRQEGVAWNAGIFLWRRRTITAALARYTGLLQSLGPMAGSPASLERAYEAIQKPVSIDYAVMEGAAQSGQVVMGSMDVGWSDLGSWSALLGALGARGTGAVVRAGEQVEVDHDDLVVRRIGGRLGVVAPPERGSMTAAQPIAVLRGTGPDRAIVEDLLERCSEPEGTT